eukprot:g77389.t1
MPQMITGFKYHHSFSTCDFSSDTVITVNFVDKHHSDCQTVTELNQSCSAVTDAITPASSSAPKAQPTKKKGKTQADNDHYDQAVPSSANTATHAKRNLMNVILDTLDSLKERKAPRNHISAVQLPDYFKQFAEVSLQVLCSSLRFWPQFNRCGSVTILPCHNS